MNTEGQSLSDSSMAILGYDKADVFQTLVTNEIDRDLSSAIRTEIGADYERIDSMILDRPNAGHLFSVQGQGESKNRYILVDNQNDKLDREDTRLNFHKQIDLEGEDPRENSKGDFGIAKVKTENVVGSPDKQIDLEGEDPRENFKGDFGIAKVKTANVVGSPDKRLQCNILDKGPTQSNISDSISSAIFEDGKNMLWKDDDILTLKKIGRLEDIRSQKLRGIISVQKRFRGYQVRSYFKELKKATILVQSLLKGKRARKEYGGLKHRNKAAVTIQKEVKCMIGRQQYLTILRSAIVIQAAMRGWLARRHIVISQQSLERISAVNILAQKYCGDLCKNETKIDAKVEGVERVPDLPKVSQNLQALEVKFSENDLEDKKIFKGQPCFISDLESRVLAAETLVKEKEHENAILCQKIHQYETRWSKYDVKLSSIEKMWQNNMTSLQQSLALVKKSLAVDRMVIQQAKEKYGDLNIYPGVPQEHVRRHIPRHDDDFDWDEATSAAETKTPDSHHAPQNHLQASKFGLSSELDVEHAAIGQLVKNFKDKTQVFNDDAIFLVEVKSGKAPANLDPDVELEKLKQRFDIWKKYFKDRLRHTKIILQRQGSADSAAERAKKKWWGKRSS